MGSNQSTISSSSSTNNNSNTTKVLSSNDVVTNSNSNNNNNDNTKKHNNQNRTGYALVEYKCRKKRKKYDLCYQSKHSAFVLGSKLLQKQKQDEYEQRHDEQRHEHEHGETFTEEVSCEELFELYKDCIYQGMLKDRQKRGLPPPKPESALGDLLE